MNDIIKLRDDKLKYILLIGDFFIQKYLISEIKLKDYLYIYKRFVK